MHDYTQCAYTWALKQILSNTFRPNILFVQIFSGNHLNFPVKSQGWIDCMKLPLGLKYKGFARVQRYDQN